MPTSKASSVRPTTSPTPPPPPQQTLCQQQQHQPRQQQHHHHQQQQRHPPPSCCPSPPPPPLSPPPASPSSPCPHDRPEPPAGDARRFARLTAAQGCRLRRLLRRPVAIHGRGNFPTLAVSPGGAAASVLGRLAARGVAVRAVRLNGSAASHVLGPPGGPPFPYQDVDLIFAVEFAGGGGAEAEFGLVREAAIESLLDFLPEGVCKERIGLSALSDAYVQKLVKVSTETDRWSLVSFTNNAGRNIEMKFVQSLRRQFEFSVDSFQIDIDPLLRFYRQQQQQQQEQDGGVVVVKQQEQDDGVVVKQQKQDDGVVVQQQQQQQLQQLHTDVHQQHTDVHQQHADAQQLAVHRHRAEHRPRPRGLSGGMGGGDGAADPPTASRPPPPSQPPSRSTDPSSSASSASASRRPPPLYAESVYGDFAEALGHLWERLIATRRPEEIRGGGLLKYCELLARGFRPHCAPRIKALERYMCSRFFIDFPDVGAQERKLTSYLRNHFAYPSAAATTGRFGATVHAEGAEVFAGTADDDDFAAAADDDDFAGADDDEEEGSGTDADDEESSAAAAASPAGPGGTARLRYDFLMRLQAVVSESTVCLMGHERRQILNLIALLAFRVLACHSGLPNAANVTCYYHPAAYAAVANHRQHHHQQQQQQHQQQRLQRQQQHHHQQILQQQQQHQQAASPGHPPSNFGKAAAANAGKPHRGGGGRKNGGSNHPAGGGGSGGGGRVHGVGGEFVVVHAQPAIMYRQSYPVWLSCS